MLCCDEFGGVVDDFIVYLCLDDDVLLVFNVVNIVDVVWWL